MIRNASGSQKPIDREIKIIYDYLSDCASNKPPETAIREFNSLFAQGKSENEQVSKSLSKIIFAPISQKQFNRVFSHCFYLIFNRWTSSLELLSYVPKLLNIIEVVANSSSYDRLRKQLIKLIANYQTSSEYLKLKATTTIVIGGHNPTSKEGIAIKSENNSRTNNSQEFLVQKIDDYLDRYTFIYEYFTPQHIELEQLNEFVRALQNSRSKDFQIKLSRHIIYRFRLKQVAKMQLLSKGAGKVISKASNPSILSEKAFRLALQQYIGKSDRQQTLQERSQKFVTDNQVRSSYRIFKRDLLLFLTENIKPKNSKYKFDEKLKNKLDAIFPQSASKPLNNTQILQTCRQLFSFLIIEPDLSDKPPKFVDLVTNLGTAQAVSVLVKITLICPESRSDLEKKISLIIDRYQSHQIQDVPWLIKALEHLLLAFSIYFGNIDVSIAKSVINDR